MGEYILLDGRPVKLGTCETLFYVRLETLRTWIESGRAAWYAGNLEPREYLNAALGWRYRFPFPDEDGTEWHGDYDRGSVWAAPALCFEGMEHEPVSVGIPNRDGGPELRVTVACPQTGAAAGDGGFLSLISQKVWEDALWSVVRCPYCGAQWRLPAAAARAMAADYAEEGTDAPELETLRRMLAGYDCKVRP